MDAHTSAITPLLTENPLFEQILVKKIKMVRLTCNLVLRLIRIRRIQWRRSFFSVLDRKHTFWAHLIQKIKILNLSWNLVPEQNSSVVFLFYMGNTLFRQAKSVQKIKIVSLSWNLVPRVTGIWRIQWRCSLFLL